MYPQSSFGAKMIKNVYKCNSTVSKLDVHVVSLGFGSLRVSTKIESVLKRLYGFKIFCRCRKQSK